MALSGLRDISERPSPVVLAVLDGWGISPSSANPVASANPPSFEYLWRNYPRAVLQSYKLLENPQGEVGSVEIGHVSIGTGRVVQDDLADLDLAISSGQFFNNDILRQVFVQAKKESKAVHLLGLLSDGGIHASFDHLNALIELAKKESAPRVWVHAFLDGEDVPSNTAMSYLNQLKTILDENIQLATVIGRKFAMDRTDNWNLTKRAYQALVSDTAQVVNWSNLERRLVNELESQIEPLVIAEEAKQVRPGRIRPGDYVVFWNFRGERLWQVIRAMIDPEALKNLGLYRSVLLSSVEKIVTLTDYKLPFNKIEIAFPSAQIENNLGQLLSANQFTQLRIAESEKASHITLYFNGGNTEPYKGEERLIIPSPKINKSYAEQPVMAAGQITRALERAITGRTHDFILVNFANLDMVARSKDLAATKIAILAIDEALRRVANACLKVGGALLVTADHGTNRLGLNKKKISISPLPFIYISGANKKSVPESDLTENSIARALKSKHTLADVAPTVLELFGIPKPSDMTGASLLNNLE